MYFPVKNPSTTINGMDFEMDLGTITNTRLYREDHGIMTFVLDFDFGGTGQNAGSYNLNGYAEFGMAVQAVIDFFGAYEGWEGIKGQKAYVLRTSSFSPVRGLMNTEQSQALIFGGEWTIFK